LVDKREVLRGERSAAASHVIRISHIVVNVTALRASADYYAKLGPLRPVASGAVELPHSPGLQLDEPIGIDWVSLDEGTVGDPVRVVLAQWRTPALVGEAYPDITSVGLVKFAFHNPDPDGKLTRLASLGITPTNRNIVRGYITVLDPDGTVVSFCRAPGLAVEQIFHVHISTTELNRSLSFYTNLLGLEYWMSLSPDAPMPASQGPGGDVVQWNSHFLRSPSDRRFTLDIGQYVFPAPHGTPHSRANEVGIAAIGFEVDDIEAAHGDLRAAMESGTGFGGTLLGEPETWDLHDGRGPVRVLHMLDPDGNRVQLAERRADYQVATENFTKEAQ
jgi:catechol 2,3-dioxygenase-like lactoylglutathione lyase family enzyme